MLTVAMPVYNREKFLDASINSILQQSYQDFEFIILDDSSTDTSISILQQYQKKDCRITILQNKTNKGEAYSRNLLIKEAKGKYLAWMDSDDTCPLYRLKEQLNFLEKNPNIDIVGGQTIVFGTKNQMTYAPLTDHNIKSHILSICSFVNPSTIFRLKKIRKYNLQYLRKFEISTDFAFLVSACQKLNFANLPRIFYHYRVHDNQLLSKVNEKKSHFTYLQSIKKHLENFGIEAEEKTIATFFPLLEPLENLVELKKLTKLVLQILSITDFYGYQGIHNEMKHKLLAAMYYQYYRFYAKQGAKKIIYFVYHYGLQTCYHVIQMKSYKAILIAKTFYSRFIY